jgi:hypothetical protein
VPANEIIEKNKLMIRYLPKEKKERKATSRQIKKLLSLEKYP